jgi:uncharacterized metal-binding protein YceD (DUF177 family)
LSTTCRVSELSEHQVWSRKDTLQLEQLERLREELSADEHPPPVNFEIELQRTERTVWAKGKIQGVLPLPCDRCCQTLKLEFEEDFSFRLIPQEAQDSLQAEVILEDEDLDVDFYEQDQINWQDLLEDQLLLTLPLQNFCEDYRLPVCELPEDESADSEDAPANNPFAALLKTSQQST